jgi:DNA-binding CsgD family transcriptional regulator
VTVERRYILIVAIALIAVAAGASVKPVRRAAASHRLYRSAMEDQAGAERLMQAGDTAAAIPLLRKAYVGFVDSGHTEAYAPMLVSISLAEEAVYHGRLTEYGYQSRVESARAAAADLLRQVAAERRRTREVWLFSLAALLLLAAGAALLLQRHRRLRLETERELLQARLELDSLHSAIPDSSTVIPNSPSVIPSAAKESSVAQAPVTPALTLALRSYEQLCSRYVPDGDNAALLHEFRQQLADMRDDAAFERELEESLSVTSPELLDAVRSVPGLKAEDRRLLRYLAAGLPTYMIGAILGKSRSAVNMQVSRLRSRIESLSPNSLLISLFDARHPGRPRR